MRVQYPEWRNIELWYPHYPRIRILNLGYYLNAGMRGHFLHLNYSLKAIYPTVPNAHACTLDPIRRTHRHIYPSLRLPQRSIPESPLCFHPDLPYAQHCRRVWASLCPRRPASWTLDLLLPDWTV